MSKRYLDFISYVKNNNLGLIELDASLKKYCTLKIGGKCYCIYKPDSINNLIKAYKYILKRKIDYEVIGNGSNLLISDEYHFKIFICLKGLNQVSFKSNAAIVSSGVMGNVLSKKLSLNQISGLEFLAGIPGTIGGMIYMNAGAWGKSISDVIKSITYLDEFGRVCIMDNIKKHGFGYRKSPFMKRRVLIISCELQLKEDVSSIKLYYDYLEKKKLTQPLKEKSAGSTFKNPNNLYAWKLINETNTIRKINDAEISSIHSNFFINKNNATFNDMRELIKRVQDDVFNTHHILLELELNIIE